jgi:hypothetical protein
MSGEQMYITFLVLFFFLWHRRFNRRESTKAQKDQAHGHKKREKTMKTEELIDFANRCSNDDLCWLINLTASRFECYFGSLNGCQLSSELSWACTNGSIIQLNCKTAYLHDIKGDEFIKYAISKEDKA